MSIVVVDLDDIKEETVTEKRWSWPCWDASRAPTYQAQRNNRTIWNVDFDKIYISSLRWQLHETYCTVNRHIQDHIYSILNLHLVCLREFYKSLFLSVSLLIHHLVHAVHVPRPHHALHAHQKLPTHIFVVTFGTGQSRHSPPLHSLWQWWQQTVSQQVEPPLGLLGFSSSLSTSTDSFSSLLQP